MGVPPASPLISRAIDVAEKRLGMEELARRLGVSESIIQTWRMGRAAMPQSDFLRLIDILTSLDIQWGEWNP
jgi:transcriptional regulator with XRE-family HTH domain